MYFKNAEEVRYKLSVLRKGSICLPVSALVSHELNFLHKVPPGVREAYRLSSLLSWSTLHSHPLPGSSSEESYGIRLFCSPEDPAHKLRKAHQVPRALRAQLAGKVVRVLGYIYPGEDRSSRWSRRGGLQGNRRPAKHGWMRDKSRRTLRRGSGAGGRNACTLYHGPGHAWYSWSFPPKDPMGPLRRGSTIRTIMHGV
jgi:hypothetical protein